MRLSEGEIAEILPKVPDWKRDGKWIERKFRFPTFMQSIHFVNLVAEVAEQMNHHPLIHIEYRVVTLRLTSWHAGGLTEKDFSAAQRYDQLYDELREEEE